jgi:GNAT superfamily N-acetyltransferase
VEAAQNWAKEKGAAEMRLETWEFPGGPLPFYEKIGYRTIKRTLKKDDL